MVELLANSGDHYQMPHSVASDLSLNYMLITLVEVSRLKWVKKYISSSNDLLSNKSQITRAYGE